MPYFDIKLTAVSEGHIIKDTGRVVITDNPDPLPPPSQENLMVWDCVYFDNKGTRSLNYTFKPGHEYAICILDAYKSNELVWANFPFTEKEDNPTFILNFPHLDDYALYKNGRVYVDGESDRASRIYRVLERPMRTIGSESERTNPGEWLAEDINLNYDWQTDREYFITAREGSNLYAGHGFTHRTWHAGIRRLHNTHMYIMSFRRDNGNRHVIFLGAKGVASGGSSSQKRLQVYGRQQVARAYSRPFDISTSSDVAENSNIWIHKLTKNKQDKGFGVTNFNWQKNNDYMVMGLDTEGDWEIGAGLIKVDDKIEQITTYEKYKGISCLVGAPSWASLIMDRNTRKVSGRDGPGISVYQKPLLLSDETCGSSSTLPVNNEGNWVVNELPINAFENTEDVSGTPVSYISNCGIALHLNKGLTSNNIVGNVNGSILAQVLNKVDDSLQNGTDLGVLQVAQFDWQANTDVELSVTRKQLVGDLDTVPNTNSVTQKLTAPLVLAVDDFDEGVVQFDISAKITQADGDVIQFGVMQLLINKTSGKDTANTYMRHNEKLF